MKQAQQVVARIQELLKLSGSASDVDAKAIARTYATLCKEANDRLELCERYLNSGRTSEAIHIAETSPDLLSLCCSLVFDGREKWAEWCVRQNLTVAPQIQHKIVDKLNDCYSSAMALEPVIQEYRKAVREKDLRKCINLLLRLQAIEPGNQNWAQDLIAFEKKRLTEIEPQLKQAAATNDLSTIEDLHAELSGSWSLGAPEALRSDASSQIRRIQKANALTRGKQIISRISDAFSSLDFHTAESGIKDYEQLLASGCLVPDESMNIQFDEARTWYLSEKQARSHESAYQTGLQQLQALVDAAEPSPAVGQQLKALGSYDRPIPEDLLIRARSLEETWLILAQRKRQMKTGLILFGSVLTAIAILAGVWFIQYRKLRERWLITIDRHIEQKNYPALKTALDTIGDSRRALFGRFLEQDPQIENRRIQLADVQSFWKAREVEIDGLKTQITAQSDFLKVVAEQEFTLVDENISARVNEIRKLKAQINGLLLAGMAEQSSDNYLDTFISEWKKHEDRRLATLSAQLLTNMPTSETFKQTPLEKIQKSVDTMKGIAAEALKSQGASDAALQRIRPIHEELTDILNKIGERAGYVQRMQAATTSELFYNALHKHYSDFPGDYSIALLDNPSAKVHNHVSLAEKWKQMFSEHASLLNIIQSNREATTETIQKYRNNNLMVDLRWTQSKLTDAVIIINGDRNPQEFASLYTASPKDESLSWKRDLIPGMKLSLMGHCLIFDDMINEAERITLTETDIFLAKAIIKADRHDVWDGDVKNWNDKAILNPFLKLIVISAQVDLLVALLGEKAPDYFRNLQQALLPLAQEKLDPFTWRVQAVINHNKACEEMLRKLDVQRLAKGYIFNRRLSNSLVYAGKKWIAYVDPATGALKPAPGCSSVPVETWVIPEGGQPLIRYARGTRLVPGDILLGPEDPKWASAATEQTVLKEIAVDTVESLSEFIPPLWPRQQK